MRNLFASAADSRVPTGFPAMQRCGKRVAWRDRDAASCVRAGIVEGMIDNRPPSWDHRDPFRFLRAAQVELANIIASEAASLVRDDKKERSAGLWQVRLHLCAFGDLEVRSPNNARYLRRLPPGDFPSGARSP